MREDDERMEAPFDKDTPIDTVKKDPVFRNYGHLLFPVNDWYMDGDTLGKLRLTWYSHIDSEETVEIVNTLWQRAISFIFEHAEELEVDTNGYSLWGGSAGGRMAAWIGTYGAEAFGGDELPRPAAVIMQYTGHSEYSKQDPPTFACVGERDGIADWRTMQRRLEAMSELGIPTEFHHYPGLTHGFGLGTGTAAEGWINEAIAFWETHTQNNH